MKSNKGNSKSNEWVLGQVSWFDPNTGKGSIYGDDGILYRVHEFAEIQNQKNRVLKDKARVEFQLARDSIHPIIKTIRPVELKKTTTSKPTKFREPDKESDI